MIGRRLIHLGRQSKWFGNSDYGLAALLFLLVLYIFFIYPLLGGDAFSGGAVSISFSLILIAGIVATSHHNAIRLGIVVLAVIAFLSHWLHVLIGGTTAHIVSAAAAILFFSLQTWFLSVRVFAAGTVNIYRIYGAIAVYLVLGVVWANAYVLIYLLQPAAFQFAPGAQAFEPPISEMVYFSFVTLTTIGFGDITAVHPMARSLVILEGLVGQLYPAILLARLVTQYQGHRTHS
jgi:hypothetical protein